MNRLGPGIVSPQGSSGASMGCLVAFLLPFLAVAVVTGGIAVSRLAAGELREAGFFALFALAFGGMSIVVIRRAVTARGRATELERKLQQYPDQPWLWREDWARGRIVSTTGQRLRFAWFFTIMWNAIAAPAGVAAWKSATDDGEKLALLGLLFPVIGLFLLGWALRESVRRRKYGVSVLELSTVPGVIGREIRGEILADTRVDPFEGFDVQLSCVRRRTTGSGKNRSTSERILWQEQRTVQGLRRQLHRSTIPVRVPIAPDVRESDDSNPSDRIVWRLEARAVVPGVDYFAQFEVPVFRTPESDRPQTEGDVVPAAVEAEPYRQPADSRIRVTTNPRGTEVCFGPARNPGPAFGLTVFFAIWTGAVWLMTRVDAPLLFVLLFGAVDAVLLVAVLQLWLGTSRVELSRNDVRVTSGLAFAHRTKRLRTDAIDDIAMDIGMQSGQTPFYRIRIVGTDGTKVTVGRGVRDKREAEWLVTAMKQAVGLIS